MIYIGADHAGWKLKQEIIGWLKEEGHQVKDMGAKILKQDDDYPDFAFPVAEKASQQSDSFGILICRNGIGMSIAANKVKGARAGLCTSIGQVITARAHNNCNVLVLPADFVDEEKAIKILKTFLQADFTDEKRHQRRLGKIKEYEEEQSGK